MIFLKTRSILEIRGPDRKSFLQGLITNDINKASDANLIYAAMLNAQGRFLYDFFIFEDNEKIILDCLSERRDEIFKKLNFYKLKAQVQIFKNDNYSVASCNLKSGEKFEFEDPRNENMGFRKYFIAANVEVSDESQYHFQRILQKIPESEYDLTYEKSIIAEFGFDELNAVDYKKGCYIGQELTARTHYMGQVRKKIFHIKISELKEIEKNHEISCQGKSIGIVLSSVFYDNFLHALALIKIEENQPQECTINDKKISIL